jgi:hypothetical protein
MKGGEMMKTICMILGIIIFLWGPGVEARDFGFPEITGWKKSGEIQTFIPKTLYEYINGAADLYLMNDFEELKVVEYQNEKRASVTIEVYRHKNPISAFGIYSQERLPNTNYINVGVQGYVENNVLNFLSGPYYVKISSYNTGAEDQEILLTFAKKVEENLGEKGALPPILASFPEEGKAKNSEKFIAKKFLGYSFLHSAFTADYELAGKKFKLFIIEGRDQNECRNMIQKYLEQTGKVEKSVLEGRHIISDPYHGEIDLYWQGKNIWGILNINDLDLRSKYLKLFEEGLSLGFKGPGKGEDTLRNDLHR